MLLSLSLLLCLVPHMARFAPLPVAFPYLQPQGLPHHLCCYRAYKSEQTYGCRQQANAIDVAEV